MATTQANNNDELDVKEGDLAKHLANGNGDTNETTSATPNSATAVADVNQDYQLNQALVLLKGLNTLHGSSDQQ